MTRVLQKSASINMFSVREFKKAATQTLVKQSNLKLTAAKESTHGKFRIFFFYFPNISAKFL